MPYHPESGDWIEDHDWPAVLAEMTNQQQNQGQPPQQQNWRRDLEKRAKAGEDALAAAKAAEERATKAERGLAMRDAGIDTSSPLGKFFADSYTGDVTAEAVRAAAQELGVLPPQGQQQPGQPNLMPPPGAPGTGQPSPDELAAHARMSGAGAGATGVGDLSVHDEMAKVPEIINGQWNPQYVDQIAGIVARHGVQRGNAKVTKWSNDGGVTWTGIPAVGEATQTE